MKENIKTIIKNNSVLIESYKSDFGEILSNQNDKEDFLDKSYIYLYKQINKTIQVIDNETIDITNSENLLLQLSKLKGIFFEILSKNHPSNNWVNIVSVMQNLDEDFKVITPEVFTENHIETVIKRLYKTNNLEFVVIEQEQQSKVKNFNTWFDVGVKFANGEIYEHYKNGKGLTGSELKEKVFGKDSADRFRTYTDCTLNNKTDSNKQKNIFARTKAKMEQLKVIEHCLENNFEICEKFKEEYSKIENGFKFN